MVAACVVYGVGGRLIFNTQGWWDGPRAWTARPIFTHVPDTAEPSDVGRGLIGAIEASASVIEGEDHGEEELLRLAGVRSYHQLTRRARLVNVTLDEDGVYDLMPTSPRRPGRGWNGPSTGTRLADPTEEELGRALLATVAQSPTYDEAHPVDER